VEGDRIHLGCFEKRPGFKFILCSQRVGALENMDGDSGGDLSDGLDEFEASAEERQAKGKGNAQAYANKPYDEAYEISQDLSVAESYDGRDAKVSGLFQSYGEAFG